MQNQIRDPNTASTQTKPLYVGCATGFSGDRTDGAGPVVDTLIALGGGV